MQAEILNVAGDQAHLLARPDHLAQRRQMITGEDIFVGERIGASRAVAELSDRVQHHHPVGLQQLATLGEEFLVMGMADMLEHADRDDPVERFFDMAIIDQFEPDVIGDAGPLGAFAGNLELMFG